MEVGVQDVSGMDITEPCAHELSISVGNPDLTQNEGGVITYTFDPIETSLTSCTDTITHHLCFCPGGTACDSSSVSGIKLDDGKRVIKLDGKAEIG